ncbi:MAG: hypothetical protein L6R41_003681 [Letrouitia leprolyta]|nr:MAG: hypothetical protein L6R41_003681 [Letrouitia leprolyta]
MRIDIPEPRYQPGVATDYGDSDLEGTIQETTTTDEDVQSVIGISISRTQTRLKSPAASEAEKAAAFDGHGEDALLGLPTDYSHASHAVGRDSQCHQAPESSRLDYRDPASHHSPVTTMPTPWTSEPKLFEKDTAQRRPYEMQKAPQRSTTGNVGSLIDLNIRRFMSSFTMPSLPKPSNLRDISMPALSTFMGGKVETRPPDYDQRRRRANSDMSQRFHQAPQRLDSLNWNSQFPKGANIISPRQDSKNSPQIGDTKPHCRFSDIDDDHIRQPSLKRARSDQSLTLCRAASTASSLGDDSRWEHVQKQVNSRAKAIADTFQDTNIRLPSLPSLSSMNLSVLKGRPAEFLRNRAVSDITRPSKPSQVRQQEPEARNVLLREHKQMENAQDGASSPVNGLQKPFPSVIDRALDCLTGDVVILGGYRGSVLRSATPPNRQLWVPVKVGLNIRKVNLEVGLGPEDEEKMEETIIPSGMLSHIGPVDMGRRLLKRVRACRNAQEGRLRVHEYGYDWRLSPHLLSRRLAQFLQSLPSNSKDLPKKERGAIVIAHSLGGLITRHAVNQDPELFAGVVYAGVPQHCVNILGPLRKGDEVLLSSKVLTAQVNFTFRTSFLLLPEDGLCFIDKGTKEEYPVNFFDATEWKCYAFSPCIAPPSLSFAVPERKGILSFMTDNLSSLPLIERRGSDPKSKVSGTPVVGDVDPKLDSSHPSRALDTAQSTIPLQEAESYLTRTLADTMRFKTELRFNEQHAQSNAYPPLSVLYSTSVPTVSRARVASREAIKCIDAYDNLAFASGDGVCLARAAMLPEGYRHVPGGKVRTERGHVGLLGDLEAVGKCLLSIIEARKKGIGLGALHCEHVEQR